MFAAGDRVRLKDDPSVVGVITGGRDFERSGRRFVEVELPAGKASDPTNQLVSVPAAPAMHP